MLVEQSKAGSVTIKLLSLPPAQRYSARALAHPHSQHPCRRRSYAGSFVVTDNSIALHSVAQPDLSITGIATAAGVPAARLHPIATTVTSTYEEAMAVRALAEEQDWHSLIVVTSPVHTRRSRAVFRSVFADSGVTVMVQPASAEEHDGEFWWQDEEERELVLNEYLKLFAFSIGYRR
jgi:uncharacterized SAM-binding protein YcdF (DUF218 family)